MPNKLQVEHYLEWCKRKEINPKDADNVFAFKYERVFKDNADNLYFGSLDDLEFSDFYNTFVFYGPSVEVLTELEW